MVAGNTYSGKQRLGDKKKVTKEQLEYVVEQMALKEKWAEKELETVKEEHEAAKAAVKAKKDEEAEDDPEANLRGDKQKK